jgi:hypothetical protein
VETNYILFLNHIKMIILILMCFGIDFFLLNYVKCTLETLDISKAHTQCLSRTFYNIVKLCFVIMCIIKQKKKDKKKST